MCPQAGQKDMARPAVHLHGDLEEGVAGLPSVPLVGVALHGPVDAPLKLGNGGLLRGFDLFRCMPLVRRGGMPAKRTEHFLVAYLVARVLLEHLELGLALLRRALLVEIALRIGMNRHRHGMGAVHALQLPDQFVEHGGVSASCRAEDSGPARSCRNP